MARRVPLKEAATPDALRDALTTLSDADVLRLHKNAAFRMRGLGPAALGRNAEDLLQEAFAAVWCDDRRWNPAKVDFVRFLCEAMRSIATNWRQKHARADGEELLCDDRPGENDRHNPLMSAPSDVPDPEQQALARSELEKIERRFAEDPHVADIIAGLEAGMSGPEIMEAAGLSEHAYRAAMRRFRRTLKREVTP